METQILTATLQNLVKSLLRRVEVLITANTSTLHESYWLLLLTNLD